MSDDRAKQGPRFHIPKQMTKLNPRLVKAVMYINAATLVLLVCVVLTLTVLIDTPAVHRRVIRALESEAHERLGLGLHLQNFALHWSKLGVDLYGVTVDGEAPYRTPPVLQVQRIQAGVRIVSVFRRQWYFDSIEVDQPTVQVFVDKNGASNLPKLKSDNSGSNTSIFDLGVRHAILKQGEAFINDRRAPMAADLHDLEFHASFNSLLQKYSATLAYANGRLQYGSFRPFEHSFDATFDATPKEFHVTQAKLASGAANAVVSATVENFADPVVDATYWANVDGAALGRVMQVSSVPEGVVEAAGSISYRHVANDTMLGGLVVDGKMTSRQILLSTGKAKIPVSNITGQFSVLHGDANLTELHANTMGGSLQANGSMKNLDGDIQSHFNASLIRASLTSVQRVFYRGGKLPVSIDGAASVKASASWTKTLNTLVAKIDTTLAGKFTSSKRQDAARNDIRREELDASAVLAAPVPFSGEIHATYSNGNSELAIANSFLRTPQTNLTMNGAIRKSSSLAVRLEAGDLSQAGAISGLFLTSSGEPLRLPGDLAGSALFAGTITGSTDAPQVEGQLSVTNLRANGSRWKLIRSDVALSPSQLRLSNAELQPADRGHIALHGSMGLTKWSPQKSSALQVGLNASQVDVTELIKLSGAQYPVTGTANANLNLHGTVGHPEGDGTVSLVDGGAYQEPIHLVKVTFSGNGQLLRGDVDVELRAGSIKGNYAVNPEQKTYAAQLMSSGVELGKLETVKARGLDVSGEVHLAAKGSGSFDNPGFDATVSLPKLAIQGQTLSDIHLQTQVADHMANASLGANAVNTPLQGKAKIQLSGDYLSDVSLDTQPIPLQTLLAIYAPEEAQDVSGQTEVHATFHGPLKNYKAAEAHLNIPVLKAQYKNSVQLASASPIQIDYKDGTISLQPAAIRGTDTDLQLQGSIPTTESGKMSLRVQGNVNLQLAQLFNPDIRTSGALKFNIDSNGPITDTNLGGQIDIVDANFASLDYPVGLQHGNGVLKLTRNRLDVTQFQGNVGGGTLTAQGGIVYRPSIQFDLALAARGARVLYPQGMRETADALLRMTGTPEHAMLGGNVNLSDLSFTPAFDLSSFVSQLSGGVETPSATGMAQNIGLNITVRSANNVNLVSRSLSVGGTANLQVRGTAADPVLLGRVNLSGGDIILNGNRFVLTGGTVQFVNPSVTQPIVNLTLTTSIQQYNISMRFDGPTDQLRTQYTSDPALPQADIINLLAFGQTTEAAANSPTTANQAAESLIASQVSSQVTGRVSKIAGISQLSINPVLAGSNAQGPPGANLTIQQRVTGNLFVTFSTNVASTQSQTIQGQYQVSPRVAVSATRDPNGGFAFDALIKKSW